jgi:hypothetical protein
MVIAWSSSFTNKVNQARSRNKKTTPAKVVAEFDKPKEIKVEEKKQSVIQSSTDYVATTEKPKSAYQLQLEKIARTEEHKNRTTDESLNIHSQKILGIDAGNTSNYFVNNKTGEVTKNSTSSNLDTYLKENGLTSLTQDSLIPKKNEEIRMAIANREIFLRKEAEIKALGGTIPELNLMNPEQISKFNEISNIITQSKPDTSVEALKDVDKSVNNFLSIDDPITQTPKTIGDSQVQKTSINDSTVLSLGFTPEAFEAVKEPENNQENKKFVDDKTSIGLGAIGLGVGALGLFYLLSKRKKE